MLAAGLIHIECDRLRHHIGKLSGCEYIFLEFPEVCECGRIFLELALLRYVLHWFFVSSSWPVSRMGW